MKFLAFLCVVVVLFINSCTANDPSQNSAPGGECSNDGNPLSKSLCKSCIAKFFSSRDTAEALIREIQRQLAYADGRIKLTDLNDDVLYLILDQLDFMDMMKFLEIFPAKELLSVGAGIFRKNFKDYEVIIDKQLLDRAHHPNFEADQHLKRLKLYEFDSILKFVKFFGHEMHSIEYSPHSFRMEESNNISQNINEYARKSLKCLKLKNVINYAIEPFTKPFEEVEELLLTADWLTNYYGDIRSQFNQLFPRVRNLTLSLSSSVKFNFIDCEFPHLEHLKLFYSHDYEFKIIENFLKKNSQVKSIHASSIRDIYVQIIGESLPNLENVTFVNRFHITKDKLQFEHVKHLILSEIDPDSIGKLSLPQLESFQVHLNSTFGEKLVSFFKAHTHMKRLYLKISTSFETISLDELVADLIELEELKVECEYDMLINVDIFRKLFNSNRKLMRIRLYSSGRADVTAETINEIQTNFANEWNIQFPNGNLTEIAFEKKTISH